MAASSGVMSQNLANGSGTPNPLRDNHILIQEDQMTLQSTGSLFKSPRMRVEEEFKVPKSVRTQSFREEGVAHDMNK